MHGRLLRSRRGGFRVECAAPLPLEDVTRADWNGFVLPFVDRLMRMSEQVPEELSVKIRICDTMGFGLHFPGAQCPAASPRSSTS